MNSTTKRKERRRRSTDDAKRPIVFHLRRYRFWHGEQRLRQAELAALAGVSTRQLRDYEQATRLPKCIASLLGLALALNVHVEDLIARQVLDSAKARVAENRAALESRRHHNKRCRRHP